MHPIVSEKYVDESKQGEVFTAPEINGSPTAKKLYLESYGCAMNFADSEVVASILATAGYVPTSNMQEANAILINTCAIRDNAEQKVRTRLLQFGHLKVKNPALIVGVLGCMAERLKAKFLDEEKLLDLVVGPDAYRDLPRLLETAETGHKAVNVFLSREETYADIDPIRLDSNGVTAFVSIMRGCNNMCSFCVVPYTRGRERSRPVESILTETRSLVGAGYKEVTLLGQNVDSYHFVDAEGDTFSFAQLLEAVALVSPSLRVRFSTSHPKDINEDVVRTMLQYPNICNYIHLPVQSGSTEVLANMNRTYSREEYLQRVDMIRSIIPDIGLSTDIIAGFCDETEEQHQETLTLLDAVRFQYAYMYMYSERPGTPAAKKMTDSIPEEIKTRRLQEIIALQHEHALQIMQSYIGQTVRVLIEGPSKRSTDQLKGRNDQNCMVIFPKLDFKPGQYVDVLVHDCTSATLFGSNPVLVDL